MARRRAAGPRARGVGRDPHRCPALKVEYTQGVPPVVNDPDSYALLRGAIHEAVGETSFFVPAQSMGGEDFAWYSDTCSIAMGRLGVRTPGGPVTDLHQGVFHADDRAIGVGVRTMVHAAYAALVEDIDRERLADDADRERIAE